MACFLCIVCRMDTTAANKNGIKSDTITTVHHSPQHNSITITEKLHSTSLIAELSPEKPSPILNCIDV